MAYLTIEILTCSLKIESDRWSIRQAWAAQTAYFATACDAAEQVTANQESPYAQTALLSYKTPA